MATIKGFDLFNPNKKAASTVKTEAESVMTEEEVVTEEEIEVADAADSLEIRVVRPKRVDEAEQIANYLLNGCLVFLNLESTDKTTSRRLIDYLQGAVYVLQGELQPVSSTAFIISPSGVDISGAIASEVPTAKAESAHKIASEGFGDL
jgi:cell division inhibitor SepF